MENSDICIALIAAIILLLMYYLCVNFNKSEYMTIREQNRPGTAWATEIYHDPNSGLVMDDAFAQLEGKVPAVRVIMYHRLNCSEFAPLATVFRKVRQQLESPQIRFYEEVADPLNPADYESYPLVLKTWKNGITQQLELAKYDGSFDFGEFQDWVLNDKIETMPKLWTRGSSGEVHSLYPTSRLDPSGASHNYL